ncbi:hypothetical protein C8F04DRAFT_705430 [Mycena alexandri]|uniref:Uncharacterized protein n=1 Tax=Mycena alexandri TaxID=1745969 RepID=A0AAD6WZR0_9AGAR|nr:hypothetical protein C8F04DRAFT_705430 [Mycena alexandri]
MDLGGICQGLSKALQTCKDPQLVQEALDVAEGLHIELELAYPWPPFVSRCALAQLTCTPSLDIAQATSIITGSSGESLASIAKRTFRILCSLGRVRKEMGSAQGRCRWPLFPSGTQFSTSTPPEIHHQILSSHVADTHGVPEKDWREQIDFACSCALVSRTWNPVATAILYQGCIRLSHTQSIANLLRTLSDYEGTPRVVPHLVLSEGFNRNVEFSQAADRLLEHCSNLRVLQLDGSFRDPPVVHTPFSHLHAVQLRGVSLRQFANFLSKLPNLSNLHLEEVEIFSGRQRAFRSGTDPPGDSLEDIPVPRYQLRQLHLKALMLTTHQLR